MKQTLNLDNLENQQSFHKGNSQKLDEVDQVGQYAGQNDHYPVRPLFQNQQDIRPQDQRISEIDINQIKKYIIYKKYLNQISNRFQRELSIKRINAIHFQNFNIRKDNFGKKMAGQEDKQFMKIEEDCQRAGLRRFSKIVNSIIYGNFQDSSNLLENIKEIRKSMIQIRSNDCQQTNTIKSNHSGIKLSSSVQQKTEKQRLGSSAENSQGRSLEIRKSQKRVAGQSLEYRNSSKQQKFMIDQVQKQQEMKEQILGLRKQLQAQEDRFSQYNMQKVKEKKQMISISTVISSKNVEKAQYVPEIFQNHDVESFHNHIFQKMQSQKKSQIILENSDGRGGDQLLSGDCLYESSVDSYDEPIFEGFQLKQKFEENQKMSVKQKSNGQNRYYQQPFDKKRFDIVGNWKNQLQTQNDNSGQKNIKYGDSIIEKKLLKSILLDNKISGKKKEKQICNIVCLQQSNSRSVKDQNKKEEQFSRIQNIIEKAGQVRIENRKKIGDQLIDQQKSVRKSYSCLRRKVRCKNESIDMQIERNLKKDLLN